jgi:hypothetical protein
LVYVYDPQTGAEYDVAPEVAHQQVASGQRTFAQGQMIDVVSPAGSHSQIPAEQYASMTRDGFRLESAEETQFRQDKIKYRTPGQKIVTGAEQALTSTTAAADLLTLNQLRLTENVIDTIGKEEYKKRHELNPGAVVAGEVASYLIPGLGEAGAAVKGASLAAKGARVAGTGARLVSAPIKIGQAGARALGKGAVGVAEHLGLRGTTMGGRAAKKAIELGVEGAAEGAYFGASQAHLEAVIAGEDPAKFAEYTLAGAKQGAILGGVMGGALGAVGGAASHAGGKVSKSLLGNKNIQSQLRSFRDERTMKSLGAIGRDFKKLGDDELSKIADDVIEHKLKDGSKILKAGDKTADIVPRLERAVQEVGEDLGSKLKKLDDYIEKNPALRPDLDDFFTGVRKQLDDLETKGFAGEVRQYRRAIKDSGFETLEKRWKAGEITGLEDLTKWRRELDKSLRPKKSKAGLVTISESKATQEALRNEFESYLSKTADDVAEQMGSKGKSYTDLKRKYKSLITAKQIAEGRALETAGHRYLSLSDNIGGATTAAVSGNVAGTATALIGGTGGAVVGGLVSGNLVGAAAAGGGALLHKVVRERGSSVAATLAHQALRSKKLIGKSLKGYLSKGAAVANTARRAGQVHITRDETKQQAQFARQAKKEKQARRPVMTEEQYRAHLVKVEKAKAAADTLQTDPDFPRVSQAIKEKQKTAANHLLTHAPVGLRESHDPLVPQLEKTQPNPVQLQRYARRVQVVEDPLSVLDELQANTLTPEHVDTLRSVYPGIYDDVRTEVANNLASLKEPPSRDQRLMLGILLDLPTDQSLRPDRIASAQGAIVAHQQAAMNPPAPKGGAPRVADSHMSNTERILSGL